MNHTIDDRQKENISNKIDRKKVCQSADPKKRVKFNEKKGGEGLTVEMIENHNNDIIFNMELDKEINQFEISN
jgi:hypothetical protein